VSIVIRRSCSYGRPPGLIRGPTANPHMFAEAEPGKSSLGRFSSMKIMLFAEQKTICEKLLKGHGFLK
jgi:hypothetical protein